MNVMIEIDNITKVYRKGSESFTALENVSITILKGEFVVINGSSGAGKSTLLNAAGGLIRPDSGSVRFYGNDIYKQRRRATDLYRKKHVGFMFQQFHLMPYLTVIENIRLACFDKSHFEMIDNYLAKCSLLPLRNKYPHELSVGEKQRAAFVRSIISNPEILLADEPTGNLDTENSRILMSLVADYHKNGGTVILVSHDTSASLYANRNVMLKNGKII